MNQKQFKKLIITVIATVSMASGLHVTLTAQASSGNYEQEQRLSDLDYTNFSKLLAVATTCSTKNANLEQFRKLKDIYNEVLEAEKNQEYSKIIAIIDETIESQDRYLFEAINRSYNVVKNDKKTLSILWSCKAECSFLLKQYKKALYDCDVALRFDSLNGHSDYVKALAWFELDDLKMAGACMRRSSGKGFHLAKEIISAYAYC